MEHLSCFKSCFRHETTDYSDTLVGRLSWHNTKSITKKLKNDTMIMILL